MQVLHSTEQSLENILTIVCGRVIQRMMKVALLTCKKWALILAMMPTVISADTVTLKDGTILENVRTFLGGDSVYVIFKDGSVRALLKSEVRAYLRQEVSWKTEAPAAPKQEGAAPAGDSMMRSQWSLVWRSALLPGWGQLHAGRKTAGFASMAATGLGLAYALNSNQTMRVRRAEYRENVLLFLALGAAFQPVLPYNASYVNAAINGAAFKGYDRSVDQYRAGAAVLGLVYLFQAAHAYIVGVDWVNESSPAAGQFHSAESQGLAISLDKSGKLAPALSMSYTIRM